MTVDPYRVKAGVLRETMMRLAAERDPGKLVDPMEVAVAVAGKDEKVWRKLMKPIRDEAARLAGAGEIVIMRKNKPVDPAKIRGLWRFRLLADGEAPPTFADDPADLPDDDDDLIGFDDDED